MQEEEEEVVVVVFTRENRGGSAQHEVPSSCLFHLYIGLQTELLKRLAESQWKGE